MHAKASVFVDGKPVSGVFWSQLISLSVTDREGERSDSLQMELSDGQPFLAIPRKGAIVTVELGYAETGLGFMGAYTVDQVDVECLPYKMSITGKAADMRSALKEQKERHWDNKTLGSIVEDIAGAHGMIAKVAGAISGFKYDWYGQNNVSDLHILKTLARKHNALFSIKNNTVVFAEKGAAQTSSGQSLSQIIIAPDMIIQGSCRVSFTDQPQYKKVSASYQDRDEAKRVTVEAPAHDDAQATFRLRHSYASKEEAEKAAQAKAKDLQRSADTTSVSLLGNPAIKAGMPLIYTGVREGVDGIPFIIESATHNFSKSGYTTELQAKVKK